jgi:hypothetical protein
MLKHTTADIQAPLPMDNLNPKVLDALQSVLTEENGDEPMLWRDFSSHSKD